MAEIQAAQSTFLDRLSEKIAETGSVRAVFGAPIERDGITIVPVARARWGLGGGGGSNAGPEGRTGVTGQGSGGGAAGSICPIGYIELSEGSTIYRPIRNPQVMLLAGAVMFMGLLRALVRIFAVSPRGRARRFGRGPRRRRLFA
jgi:uncharacterized spore protein YtfJ